MVAFPSSPKPRSARVSFISNVGLTTSEFTYQVRKQRNAGQRWEIDLELPPMTGEQAGQWMAFLVKMNGVEGTTQVPDPDRQTAYGVATGTPLINGASQTGGTIITDGWTTSQTGIMKAGDLLQIGDYMYMVLDDCNSDGSGNATINIGPDLRESPADNAAITVQDVTTKCRLAGNSAQWTTDNMKNYGMNISFVEQLPTS